MKRRTLLQWLASGVAALPFSRLRLAAQPRELTPEAITSLRELGSTVLPASLGKDKVAAAVDRFVAWTRGYREGVPLEHGYGHPRLAKTGPSPAGRYVAQLAALDAAARARGGSFGSLDIEGRRAILEQALTNAGVQNLPQRPNGQHVASDLMAHYFRSSAANDVAQQAIVNRQVCRPIAVTIKRPEPLEG